MDTARELSKYFATVTYAGGDLPRCDVLFVIKHALPKELLSEAAARSAVIYCPVDYYGSPSQIDADIGMLRCCSLVVVHAERLRRYFEPYAPVDYVDHHVRFVTPMREAFRAKGYILWVGVRTNLPPLIEWVNRHPLPADLHVLTNLENPRRVPRSTDLGFRPDRAVQIHDWSEEAQLEMTANAMAALDIKGADFRSRHKPPAKAIDFIASGVPLAMNPGSGPGEQLGRMGFDVASPLDTQRWLSPEYWEETRRFGHALRELFSLKRIGNRYRHIVEETLRSHRVPARIPISLPVCDHGWNEVES